MNATKRGTGRTSTQMRMAPQGAIYVTLNRQAAATLARELGREDLWLVPAQELLSGVLKGMRRPVIVDHAVDLTAEQIQAAAALDASARLVGEAEAVVAKSLRKHAAKAELLEIAAEMDAYPAAAESRLRYQLDAWALYLRDAVEDL